MSAEKAIALVVRTVDWSDTSRIAVLWTREFGKVRVLAKGGRRLKSNFESALDLLTLCSIVLLRKSSGTLDLLTEARVVERFSPLRQHLPALYAGYYVAELLGEGTEDYDPHPALFDEAVATLRELGSAGNGVGPRLARFELVLLRELGYGPALVECAACGNPVGGDELAFSAAGGGVLCRACQPGQRQKRPLSRPAWQTLGELAGDPDAWRDVLDPGVRAEMRQVLNDYVTYWWGRRPRLLPYLGN
jgi:DNA repair protein RecO (recombination protein O)